MKKITKGIPLHQLFHKPKNNTFNMKNTSNISDLLNISSYPIYIYLYIYAFKFQTFNVFNHPKNNKSPPLISLFLQNFSTNCFIYNPTSKTLKSTARITSNKCREAILKSYTKAKIK